MNRKTLYLILVFVVPISIFLFLRNFGKNQFDIPIYFKEGVEGSKCISFRKEQYHVADSILVKLSVKSDLPMIVVTDSSDQVKLNLKRLKNDFSDAEYQLIFLDPVGAEQVKCALALEESWSSVLLDSERRIRGYYNLVTLDETDRLMVELKILLKKY